MSVTFTEDGDRTRVDAVLELASQRFHGFGQAKRAPSDPKVPLIGQDLAASRALSHLAHQLLDAAAERIEAAEGQRSARGRCARPPSRRWVFGCSSPVPECKAASAVELDAVRRRREADESRAIWEDFERTRPVADPEAAPAITPPEPTEATEEPAIREG